MVVLTITRLQFVFENKKATVVVLGNGGVDDNEATVVFGSGVVDDNEAIVVILGSVGVDDSEATVVFGSGIEGRGSAMPSFFIFGRNSDRGFALREPRSLQWHDNKHVIRWCVTEPANDVTGTGDVWDSHVHTEHVIRPCVMEPLTTEGTGPRLGQPCSIHRVPCSTALEVTPLLTQSSFSNSQLHALQTGDDRSL